MRKKSVKEKNVILSAHKIRKVFTHPTLISILDDVSLELCKGESIAIMGPSGEGKSTLLHILGTLEAPDSGVLKIAGKEVTKNDAPKLRNSHIGFVFQAFNLLEDYTVLENVLMPARIAGKNPKELKEKGMALLEAVGLSHRANFATKLLSGGEKQRVALARANCNDPDVILADEPSGNLDHETSLKIHEYLLLSSQKLNKGLIIVTHNENLAELCDKRLTLCAGKLS